MIGGVDENAASLYSLDAVGGQIEERLATAQGSGSPMAFGVIEDRYHEKMPVKDGIDLAVRALSSAIKRDAASGNEMHVVTITKEGFTEVNKDEIEKRKAALKI